MPFSIEVKRVFVELILVPPLKADFGIEMAPESAAV
jgi:hypothetical protein